MSQETLKALRDAKASGTDHTFNWTNDPLCPHCGEEHNVSENESLELYDRTSAVEVIKCVKCNLSFKVTLHSVIQYSTGDQEDDA